MSHLRLVRPAAQPDSPARELAKMFAEASPFQFTEERVQLLTLDIELSRSFEALVGSAWKDRDR